MKIRIKGNSVRLRLSKTEVAKLAKDGVVTEQTDFPESIFTYSLVLADSVDKINASYANNHIRLELSKQLGLEWPNNTIVGFDAQLQMANGKSISLLIEKDFQCIDNTMNEDQTDNYENPLQSCN